MEEHVTKAALKEYRDLIDSYGGGFERIGERNGITYFLYVPTVEACIGYPLILGFRNGNYKAHQSEESFTILDWFEEVSQD